MNKLFVTMLLLAVSSHGLAQHAQDAALHADSPVDPSLVGPSPEGQPTQLSLASASLASSSTLASSGKPCKTIFGYLPYWENTSTLRWDLLTHVACFSIEINSTGAITNTRGWPWTNVINNAKANGVKVILVVALFDDSAIETLINTPAYTQNFFENIRAEMEAGDVDGLNIDFESGSGWQDDMPRFLTELNTYLKSFNPDWELTVATPAVNWGDRWDFPATAAASDGLFIMGYAYSGGWSRISGANAPLTGGSINIIDTMDDEYAGVPTDKLILGVPYYGHHWITTGSGARSTVQNFVSSTRFFNDVLDSQTYGRIWDNSTQTPWYRWFSNGQWNQIWYDDAESLGLKYDAALSRGYQGVGMWALGYDEGRNELWDALETHIGLCSETMIDFNGDGSTNITDLAYMLFCYSGTDSIYAAGHVCRVCDMDDDGDVDSEDLSFVQSYWGS